MAQLKQSTAYTRMFKLVSSTDHITAKTGATPTVNISKAGAAFGAAGGSVTEVANGWYKIALTTTDTNTLGDLAYYITASGADDTDFVDQVTGQILGDTLTANTTQFAGQTITCAGGVTIPAATLASTTNITTATGVTLNNGAQTITSLSITAGMTITQSSANASGLSITGNGTGHGMIVTSGSGVTGDGLRAVSASTNGNGITGVKTGTGNDFNCTSTPLVLAKTTNITGFNDIAATAIVSAGAITTNAGAVSNVTTVGSVTGAVGSVTGAVGSVTGNVGGNVTGSVGSLAAQAQTDVKTQAVAALNTDTYAEPGQVSPSATTTLVDKIGHLYKNMRNKKTQTSGVFSLYNDAGTVVDQKATVSDDGTTATKDKITTGP
jgi:hypothetical protein